MKVENVKGGSCVCGECFGFVSLPALGGSVVLDFPTAATLPSNGHNTFQDE